MKITKEQLKKIIKEEMLKEYSWDWKPGRKPMSGAEIDDIIEKDQNKWKWSTPWNGSYFEYSVKIIPIDSDESVNVGYKAEVYWYNKLDAKKKFDIYDEAKKWAEDIVAMNILHNVHSYGI